MADQPDWFAANAPPPSPVETAQKEPPAGAIGRALSGFWDQVNPVKLVGGLADATAHPVGTVKNTLAAQGALYDKAKDAFSKGNYVEGARHAVDYLLPIIGPQLDKLGDQAQSGDIAGAVGGTLGLGTALAAPGAASEALSGVKAALEARAAGKVTPGTGAFTADIMKAAPPSQAAPYTPATIQRAAPYLAAEHANEPIVTAQAAVDAGNKARVNIESHISQIIGKFPQATIDTNPIEAATEALTKKSGAMGAKSSDVTQGVKALDGFGLDKPVTLQQAESIRNRLNAENAAVLDRTKTDVANALRSDPKFAARYAAVQALRDGIYQKLDSLGVPDVADLRRDEGAVIQMTEAFRRQQFKGGSTAPGTGTNTLPAKVARATIPAVSGTIGGLGGALVGGLPGAAMGGGTGAVIGNEIARAVVPANLTRDAAIERAFSNLKVDPPTLPPIPTRQAPAGLITGRPTPVAGTTAPDASYVKAIPAQYAERDPTVGPTQPSGFWDDAQKALAAPGTALTRAQEVALPKRFVDAPTDLRAEIASMQQELQAVPLAQRSFANMDALKALDGFTAGQPSSALSKRLLAIAEERIKQARRGSK